jgi:quercetin dioxygenase-like cupin family protein/DNA-binding XRE family transcriptional regulator
LETGQKGAFVFQVGQRLRALREERSVSLRGLARQSGISANALSMIERGLTSPSITTLAKLSQALEVPVTALFRHEPLRQKVVLQRAARCTCETLDGCQMQAMGGDTFSGRMEAFQMELMPYTREPGQAVLHTGQEFVFCLQGEVEYEIGDQVFSLQTGDSLMFTAQLPHAWENAGSIPARILVVLSGFEEDEHPLEYHRLAVIRQTA